MLFAREIIFVTNKKSPDIRGDYAAAEEKIFYYVSFLLLTTQPTIQVTIQTQNHRSSRPGLQTPFKPRFGRHSNTLSNTRNSLI